MPISVSIIDRVQTNQTESRLTASEHDAQLLFFHIGTSTFSHRPVATDKNTVKFEVAAAAQQSFIQFAIDSIFDLNVCIMMMMPQIQLVRNKRRKLNL